MTENKDRELLTSKWFPITEVSVESIRERTASSSLPPLYFLHIWFARRPLSTSRAAILGSLLPSETTRKDFLELLGIPSDVNLQKAQERLVQAKASGVKLNEKPFFWKRSFEHLPSQKEMCNLRSVLKDYWGVAEPVLLDPMAGGGSIPFEAMRLGFPTIAGDSNPVAFVCLKGTLEYPAKFGQKLIPAVETFCKEIQENANSCLREFFPKQSGEKVYAYLWAKTIRCPSCGLTIPLSPNWWIVKSENDDESISTKPILRENINSCDFGIIHRPKSQGIDPDKGTVKGGRAECPRCHTVMESAEIKAEAQKGNMRNQLYCVCVKVRVPGKTRLKWDFRTPRKDEIEALTNVESILQKKLPIWIAQNMVPIENFPEVANDTRPLQYGMFRWCDMFSPRQLFSHVTYLEKFRQAKEKIFEGKKKGSDEREFAEAVVTYAAMAFDACVDYNCLMSIWHPTRSLIYHLMAIQAFPFRWSYAEWDHSEMLWPWATTKVVEALKEIVALLPENTAKPVVYCGTASRIPIKDKSVPCVVVDPPYAENVMYAEVSDFFYVWLKRLLNDVYPESFKSQLTEKEEEAVSNLARFKDMHTSAKRLAQEDYKTKMEASFIDISRVLQDDGILTVMFTHRTAEAWNSLATALMNANFTFVSSWPVHTEPADKYAKRDRGVLKVTILLTCRKRKSNNPGIWEHIIDDLRRVAELKIDEFSKVGITGSDLKVSVFGPVLGKFADYYPVKTSTGKQIDPQQALDLVTDVLNEKFLQETGIQDSDKETAAYINLLATFPEAQAEYDEARIVTVFGGQVTLSTLDSKAGYGLIEKDGKNIKILSGRDRQAKGIVDPFDPKTLRNIIDYVHATILLYERGGLVQVKRLMQEKNLEVAGSTFPKVLQAYARFADSSTDENFKKDASIAKALLVALGKSIEFAPKKGERLDHYVSES